MTQQEMQELAALYALGALTQHDARVCENLLREGHNDLAEEVAGFEAVAASLAFATTEATPGQSVRQDLLAKIAAEPQVSHTEKFQLPLVPSQNFSQMFSLHTDEGDWQTIGPGMLAKTLFVDEARGLVTSLVKMMPGSSLPPHRHRGDEQFYILEGDCIVQGTKLGPGDFHHAPPGSIHESTSTVDGTTFLLIAPADYEILHQGQPPAQ